MLLEKLSIDRVEYSISAPHVSMCYIELMLHTKLHIVLDQPVHIRASSALDKPQERVTNMERAQLEYRPSQSRSIPFDSFWNAFLFPLLYVVSGCRQFVPVSCSSSRSTTHTRCTRTWMPRMMQPTLQSRVPGPLEVQADRPDNQRARIRITRIKSMQESSKALSERMHVKTAFLCTFTCLLYAYPPDEAVLSASSMRRRTALAQTSTSSICCMHTLYVDASYSKMRSGTFQRSYDA